LAEKDRVFVSLAPAWVSDFEQVMPAQITAALCRLGFSGVSETALGAQEVTHSLVKQLEGTLDPGLILSSACPAAMELTRKYFPELLGRVTPMASPLLAHCQLLRETYGEDIGIVFFGPCVAKKHEADDHPELLDLALTFEDLRRWLEEEGINPRRLPTDGQGFQPEQAAEGALYPIEGGMLENMRAQGLRQDLALETLSGVRPLQESLGAFGTDMPEQPLFVELLACSGGCAKGPCTSRRREELKARLSIRRYAREPSATGNPHLPLWGGREIPPAPVPDSMMAETALREALARIGKHESEDELNCGGCGYETCRALASALVDGKAEPTMCISYLRAQATRKANALLRSMPSGVVIVDGDLSVIESNESFARMLGPDAEALYEACPGMVGADLNRLLPFADQFVEVLRTGVEIKRNDLHLHEQVLTLTVFPIEPGAVVGGILFDVTLVEQRRDQIAHRAREVIDRNLTTVQEIACRLGEHMAETEVLLRSIADGYGR
jgi:PAS domain-containing protein